MKIIALGYSGIGKTYFLGSLFKLSFEPCQKGFSLQHKNFKELGNIEDIFTVISKKKTGMIASTQGIKPSSMQLTQGIVTVLEDVELVDIEGQALVPGERTEIAEKVEQSIKGCDRLILILQTPKNDSETDTSKIQLAQMLRFSEEVLRQNQGIPVALILNKIDSLPEAKGIGENVSKEEEKMEKELKQSQKLPVYEVDRIIESKRGVIVNKLVKPAVETKWNYRLIRQFFVWVKASKIQIPNRVFPCTTLGFGNTAENIYGGSDTLVAQGCSILFNALIIQNIYEIDTVRIKFVSDIGYFVCS